MVRSKTSRSFLAAAISSRTWETEALIALSSTNRAFELKLIKRAIVVFPEPGGPQRMTELTAELPSEFSNRSSAEPCFSACFWPTKSDNDFGR